jgi:hypothetical protein
MKNFIKIISLTTMILFTSGCGDVDRVNLDNDISTPPSTSKATTEEIKKPRDCSSLLKKSKDTIEIIDSALECPPNVDLYHAEVGKNDFKPYYEYIYDDDFKANVLYFKSNGLKNAIHIQGYDTNKTYEWADFPNYQNKFNISWDAKFSNDFIIYIVVKFKVKNKTIQKDLVYTPSKDGYPYYTKDHLHISLGKKAKDGEWHHYERNIINDIRRFYPDAKIVYKENYYKEDINYVNGFALKGTGSITNIMLNK